MEELEFELIDAGLEELYLEADEDGTEIAVVQTEFEDLRLKIKSSDPVLPNVPPALVK